MSGVQKIGNVHDFNIYGMFFRCVCVCVKTWPYVVHRVRRGHATEPETESLSEREENSTCAAQSESVTQLESFPIMKQDMERLCFNGEREGERER